MFSTHVMACVGADVGSLPTIRVDVSMFPHLTGFMFACERLVSGYWWRCCLAHGHQPRPPGDMQSMAVFFGRFCPLFYSFKGHIMKNKRQCCQLWRCSILVRPGEDDLRFLDRAGHINRDPDLISTKVGENWPIILTFVKIRPPFVKKIFHFSVNITVEFAR